MEYIQNLLQLTAGLGILNVWLLRFNKSTPYRGGNASSMKEEFSNYGLPAWSVYLIGFLKVAAAGGLLLGLFIPALVVQSAGLLGALMIGALSMHLKVGDPLVKSIPAVSMLVLCIGIAVIAT
ncbi:MAG TPA: hypothetical protein DCE52_03740 [Rhodobacteraceae bacterium]|nr:hypothetical protein [Paracoccaceae bacterium]